MQVWQVWMGDGRRGESDGGVGGRLANRFNIRSEKMG